MAKNLSKGRGKGPGAKTNSSFTRCMKAKLRRDHEFDF